MFELYRSHLTNIGTVAEVWIDKNARLCKKYYRLDSMTASGNPTIYKSMEKLTKFFTNEVQWSTALKSPHILELYEYGELPAGTGYYILQEYIGPDLLTVHLENKLHDLYPDIVDQLEDIFSIFKQHNIYKLNTTLCNMTGENGKIKMFDFKYTQTRTFANRVTEEYSITEWLTKIDPLIADRLFKYI